MMRQISVDFSIPFDLITIGSYDASNSGVFSIPFDSVTIGSYDASNSEVLNIPFDSVTQEIFVLKIV